MSRGLPPSVNLSRHLQSVFDRGFYRETQWFGMGLRSVGYTQTLADAVFVPLPAGDVPDQFRIHEALEAGAFPVLTRQHVLEAADPYLSYFTDLGLEPLFIRGNGSYDRLLDTLYPFMFVPKELLDAWQAQLYRRYRLQMTTLRKEVASRVCQLVHR